MKEFKIFPAIGQHDYYWSVCIMEESNFHIRIGEVSCDVLACCECSNGSEKFHIGNMLFQYNKIDLQTIVHECTHAAMLSMSYMCGEYIKSLDANSADEYIGEGVPVMCDSLFRQICEHLNIPIEVNL